MVWVIIIIVGVIGNSLVIYVVTRFAKMQVRSVRVNANDRFEALFSLNVRTTQLTRRRAHETIQIFSLGSLYVYQT